MMDLPFLMDDGENITTTTLPYPSTLAPAKQVECKTHHYNNKTVIFYGGYEGIPENLLINVIAWMVCIILFCFLRKSLGNYGRIGLIEGPHRRPTVAASSTYDMWSQTEPESLHSPDHHDADSVTSVDTTAIDRGIFSWIIATFMLSDEQILSRCGSDAVHYLSFQRHLIMLMMIFTFLSLTIALPVNMRGTKVNSDYNQFASTTLSNLDSGSWLVVIHITLSIAFFFIGIYFVRRFSARLKVKETESYSSRTLMITKFPISMCNKDSILRHFQEAYPNQPVEDVVVVSDMNRVLDLEKKNLFIEPRNLPPSTTPATPPLRLRPWTCGYLCSKLDCCECCQTVDALDYYASQERHLAEEIADAKKKALCTPLGIVFVTFSNFEDARKILKDHRIRRRNHVLFGKNPGRSSLSTAMRPEDWNVEFAPPPNDIYWEHLRLSSKYWFIKWIFIHAILFIVLIFFSTPSVVINSINVIWGPVKEELTKLNPLFSEFAATVLLLSTATLLPVLISLSDRFLSHWTRSSANLSVMVKTFIFLLFMVLLLPSLGLASIDAFIQWTFNVNGTTRWDCVFLPDNGAFFVNYIVTSAFVGTSMDLMRLAELIYYATCLALSTSRAEHLTIRQGSLFEFGYGVQYAWILMKFSVVVMYSLSCPLITPFGLVYLSMKHFVDRYNIYFAYAPSKINKRVHIVAIYFLVTALCLLQLCFFFFSLLRRGLKDVTIYALIGLVFTLLLIIAQTSFHLFKKIGPILYKPYEEFIPGQAEEEDEVDTGNQTYSPPYKLTNGNGLTSSASSESHLEDMERGNLSSSPRRTYGTESPSVHSDTNDAPTVITFRTNNGVENPLYQNY